MHSTWKEKMICPYCQEKAVNITDARCSLCPTYFCTECITFLHEENKITFCCNCAGFGKGDKKQPFSTKRLNSSEVKPYSGDYYYLLRCETYAKALELNLERLGICKKPCTCCDLRKQDLAKLNIERPSEIKYQKWLEMNKNTGERFLDEMENVTNVDAVKYTGSFQLSLGDDVQLKKEDNSTTTMGEVKTSRPVRGRRPWQKATYEKHKPFEDGRCDACKEAGREQPGYRPPSTTSYKIGCGDIWVNYRETTPKERKEGYTAGEDVKAFRNGKFYLIADQKQPCENHPENFLCLECHKLWVLNKALEDEEIKLSSTFSMSTTTREKRGKILLCGKYKAHSNCISTCGYVDEYGVWHNPVPSRRKTPNNYPPPKMSAKLAVVTNYNNPAGNTYHVCQGSTKCYDENKLAQQITRDQVYMCRTCMKPEDPESYDDHYGCKAPDCNHCRVGKNIDLRGHGPNGVFCVYCISIASSLVAEMNFLVNELQLLVDSTNINYPDRGALKLALKTFDGEVAQHYSQRQRKGFMDGSVINDTTALPIFKGIQFLRNNSSQNTEIWFARFSKYHRLYNFLSLNPRFLHQRK